MELLVSGCSFTKGYGLDLQKDDPRLWVNQLSKKLNANTVNIAEFGYNNQTIFLETLDHLRKNHYDLVIVAWSLTPRWNFRLGFELYPTFTHLNKHPINTNLRNFSASWQQDLKNKLLEGYNDHWVLLELVKYVNILINLQKNLKKQKIVFVNTFGPWSDNFFTKKEIIFPSDLDSYTQDILNVDTRDDVEIFELYDLMHKQYSESGGIQEQHWLNLYNSFEKLKIDNASPTDIHPGYASQDVFVDYLWPILEEKLK
jgi:hypothetical protein